MVGYNLPQGGVQLGPHQIFANFFPNISIAARVTNICKFFLTQGLNITIFANILSGPRCIDIDAKSRPLKDGGFERFRMPCPLFLKIGRSAPDIFSFLHTNRSQILTKLKTPQIWPTFSPVKPVSKRRAHTFMRDISEIFANYLRKYFLTLCSLTLQNVANRPQGSPHRSSSKFTL